MTRTSKHPVPDVIELADVDTAVGAMTLAVSPDGLCVLEFADLNAERLIPRLERRFPGVPRRPGERADRVATLMQRYLAGEVKAVDTIAVDAGGTEFQRAVWKALREIPAGETISYGELARRIGRPKAVRAVGAANGANPVAIVVPCHRVVASDGTLHGYAGGLERKRWLLDHERQRTMRGGKPRNRA